MSGFGDEKLIWRGDSGTSDLSGSGNDATYFGGMGTIASEGSLAYSFDGTNDSMRSANAIIGSSSMLTFAGWFNSPDKTDSHRLMGQYTTGTNGRTVLSLVGSDLRAFAHGTGAAANSPYSENAWELWGVTVYPVVGSPGVVEVWRNGLLVESASSPSPYLIEQSPFAVGAESNGSGVLYDGLADDVRVFERQLSAAEWSAWNTAGRGYDAVANLTSPRRRRSRQRSNAL